MARRPSPFTQADVTRALKAAHAVGLTVASFKIDPERGIVVTTTAAPPEMDDLDIELKQFEAKPAILRMGWMLGLRRLASILCASGDVEGRGLGGQGGLGGARTQASVSSNSVQEANTR